MTTRLRLAISAACALLSVGCCLAYADSVRAEAARERADALERFGGEVAGLVVATHQLEAGDVVGEQAVALRDWVLDLAPEGALTSLDEVVGRQLSSPVAEGMPLTELAFRDGQELLQVPKGAVALSVPLSERLGLAQGVSRGARVSAYAVDGEVAHLIATDVEVLSEAASVGSLSGSQQVTIAVSPDEVAAVLAASTSGELRLVMPAEGVAIPDEAPVEGPPEEASHEDEGAADALAPEDGEEPAEAPEAPETGDAPEEPTGEAGDDNDSEQGSEEESE